jgi:UrcA family protein
MKTMQKISGLGGALLITAGMVAGFATTVEAAPPAWAVETRSVSVRHADLDLGHEAGVRALYARLRVAAGNACGNYGPRDLAARADWRRCRDEALAGAVERFGDARVAEVHRLAQGGGERRSTRIARR